MKLPLYEEVETFLIYITPSPEGFELVMPYYVSIVYFLLLMGVVKHTIYTPLRLLTKKNKKENFWSQYDTGGI